MHPQNRQVAEESITLGRLLALVYRCHTNELRSGLGQAGLEGLRPAHTLVFEYLEPEGSRITDLARQGHLTKQAFVLERLPDPTDARAKLVCPTDRGRRVMRASRRVVAGIDEEWTDQLGPSLKANLVQALEVLAGACYD